MRIGGRDGEIVLRLPRREFPGAADPDDAAWIVIDATVRHVRGTWSFLSPCLQDDEVRELAQWLAAVAEQQVPFGSKLSFLEPMLEFEVLSYVSMGAHLRVWFSHDALPPFVRQYEDYGPDEEFQAEPVDFVVSSGDLRRAAEELVDDLVGLGDCGWPRT